LGLLLGIFSKTSVLSTFLPTFWFSRTASAFTDR